jgi:hypothetical protein
MKKFNQLLDSLHNLNLDPNDFAVFGSAPLVITGVIEDVNDFDVIIRPQLWPFGDLGEARTDNFEFFKSWPNEDVNDLIDNHYFWYKGVKFIFPKKVIEYKKRLKRQKDSNLWEE